MTAETQHMHTPTFTLFKRLIRDYITPFKQKLFWAWGFMGIDAMMTGLQAWLMKPIFDQVFGGKEQSYIFPVAAAVFMTFVIRGGASYVHGLLMNKVGQGVVVLVQKRLFGHLMASDLSFFHNTTSGRLISSITNDVNVMRTATSECLTSMGKNVITLVFLVGVMFYQDWFLASFAFLAFPFMGIFVSRLGKKLRGVSKSMQSEFGHFSTMLNQVFQGIRHVKAYNMEASEQSRMGKIIDTLYKLNQKTYRVSALSTPIGEILSALAISVIILYGGTQIMDGTRTSGELMSFITAFILSYEPLKRLAKLNAHMQAGLAATDRIYQMMEITPQIQDRADAGDLKVKEYGIRFETVNFSYEKEGHHQALSGIDIQIEPGKTVALVGSSGAGKSTILNLIPRFYDPASGRILIGGTDIRDVQLSSLRAAIALVSQEIVLFNETIRENITYGRPSASEVDIISAAKSAAAHEFITKLPQGYDTVIGEHGVKLSGGQRQRISIARAMLKNAPILLLDEATSALDTESERDVQQALRELQKGRTTLVIAHRLSTIMDADKIYVLDQGRVVQEGTHQELMKLPGIYKRLHGAEPA